MNSRHHEPPFRRTTQQRRDNHILLFYHIVTNLKGNSAEVSILLRDACEEEEIEANNINDNIKR